MKKTGIMVLEETAFYVEVVGKINKDDFVFSYIEQKPSWYCYWNSLFIYYVSKL